jgi:hypothetical protein
LGELGFLMSALPLMWRHWLHVGTGPSRQNTVHVLHSKLEYAFCAPLSSPGNLPARFSVEKIQVCHLGSFLKIKKLSLKEKTPVQDLFFNFLVCGKFCKVSPKNSKISQIRTRKEKEKSSNFLIFENKKSQNLVEKRNTAQGLF